MVEQVYDTEVSHCIRFLPLSEADEGGHCIGHDLLKVPLGIGSACLNVCVIKSTLRPSRLQLADAETPINDFNLDRGWKLASRTTFILPLWQIGGASSFQNPDFSSLLVRGTSSGHPLSRVRFTRITHMVKTWHVSVPCSSDTHVCWCPKGRYDKWESSNGIPPVVMELD